MSAFLSSDEKRKDPAYYWRGTFIHDLSTKQSIECMQHGSRRQRRMELTRQRRNERAFVARRIEMATPRYREEQAAIEEARKAARETEDARWAGKPLYARELCATTSGDATDWRNGEANCQAVTR